MSEPAIAEPIATLLLVEDDLALAQWISDFLIDRGYRVLHFQRGDDALAGWQQAGADLILLDLMLPAVNGLSLCRTIRTHSDVPILMLTAQHEEVDEVLALESGVNDYLIKPIRPRALLARVESYLKQQRPPPVTQQNASSLNQKLNFGQLEINLQAHRVRLAEQHITLSSSEFKLLSYLAQHAGQVLSRQNVFFFMTGRDYDGFDRRIDMLISVLRRKLQDNSQAPARIKTVWGQGYLFVADAWE